MEGAFMLLEEEKQKANLTNYVALTRWWGYEKLEQRKGDYVWGNEAQGVVAVWLQSIKIGLIEKMKFNKTVKKVRSMARQNGG